MLMVMTVDGAPSLFCKEKWAESYLSQIAMDHNSAIEELSYSSHYGPMKQRLPELLTDLLNTR